jgi:REP element-mobilizing transposase RayT
MKSASLKHQRRCIRLKDYDYSQSGAYFITLCTHNWKCIFGHIVDEMMRLNHIGRIVAEEWMRSAEIRHEVMLDAWVVMPNHVHAIVVIANGCRGDRPVAPTPKAPSRPIGPAPKSLSSLVAGFKSAAAKRVNELRGTAGQPLWQRNYYEHIIRNENECRLIRKYIHDNPLKWALDRENPAVCRGDRPVAPTDAVESVLYGRRKPTGRTTTQDATR